jgi:hypothetical protein
MKNAIKGNHPVKEPIVNTLRALFNDLFLRYECSEKNAPMKNPHLTDFIA